MRKIIFLICLLGLFQSVQAEGLKGKFMLTAKTAFSFALPEHSMRKSYHGAEIGYFLDRQFLFGLNFDYLRYDERPYFEYENIGPGLGYIIVNPQRWYSAGLFGKIFFDIQRFMPFVRMGFGLYVPRVTHYPTRFITQGIIYARDLGYGKTSFGMNFGAGLQYRIWKGFCLQTEGLLTIVPNKNEEIGLNHNFTYTNLNAGLSIIF